MTDYLTFEGVIEPMVWGGSTFTILRLPNDVAASLKAEGARRVEGEIAEHPVNLALTKSPQINGPYLYTGKSFLQAAGIAPGERLEVRLRKADPDVVDLPKDVQNALRSAGVTTRWEALSPGAKRSKLARIATAKRSETRIKRISALIHDLDEGQP